jgi:hypothetical protein
VLCARRHNDQGEQAVANVSERTRKAACKTTQQDIPQTYPNAIRERLQAKGATRQNKSPGRVVARIQPVGTAAVLKAAICFTRGKTE